MGQVPVSAGTGAKVINAVLTTSEEPKKENQLFFLRSSKKLKSQQNDTSKIGERPIYRQFPSTRDFRTFRSVKGVVKSRGEERGC